MWLNKIYINIVKETLNKQIKFNINPVNFSEEIETLKKLFTNLNKELNISIQLATMSNLSNALSKRPKIIHFICHG